MSQRTVKQWSKPIVVFTLAVALMLSLAATSPAQAGGPVNRMLGVVPARGSVANQGTADAQTTATDQSVSTDQSASPNAARPARVNNLAYHNGPVMHTNVVYAIYWVPSGYSVSSGYVSTINQFFQNVAADNGKTSNVYFSDTQYTDKTNGNILYNSTFGGYVVDTNPFPTNGCTDSYTSKCLTDAQLRTEIQHVMSAQGWTAGSTHLFFMFTPKNVGSCSGSSCAFSYFCAYHSWSGSGSSALLYANQPYAAFVPSACDAGQHPNGDDADATINVVSHEHNEAITDPQGSAWYDRTGAENGDKCAWNFGTALGSTSYGQYNQAIGSGKYYLQQEWSNYSSKCVLTNK
jgi:hypothetical protein